VPVRILLFYVLAIGVIVLLTPWRQITGEESPFVQIFDTLGVSWAAAALNIVVITAALSAINADLFGAGRVVAGMARHRLAPEALSRTVRGVPVMTTLAMLGVLVVGVVLNWTLPDEVFTIVASLATFATVFVWLMILLAQVASRRGMSRAERDALEFPVPLWPYGQAFAIAFILFTLGIMVWEPEYHTALAVGAGVTALMSRLSRLTARRRSRARRDGSGRRPVRAEVRVRGPGRVLVDPGTRAVGAVLLCRRARRRCPVRRRGAVLALRDGRLVGRERREDLGGVRGGHHAVAVRGCGLPGHGHKGDARGIHVRDPRPESGEVRGPAQPRVHGEGGRGRVQEGVEPVGAGEHARAGRLLHHGRHHHLLVTEAGDVAAVPHRVAGAGQRQGVLPSDHLLPGGQVEIRGGIVQCLGEADGHPVQRVDHRDESFEVELHEVVDLHPG